MNFENIFSRMQNYLFFQQFREITWEGNRSIDKIWGGKVTIMREM